MFFAKLLYVRNDLPLGFIRLRYSCLMAKYIFSHCICRHFVISSYPRYIIFFSCWRLKFRNKSSEMTQSTFAFVKPSTLTVILKPLTVEKSETELYTPPNVYYDVYCHLKIMFSCFFFIKKRFKLLLEFY